MIIMTDESSRIIAAGVNGERFMKSLANHQAGPLQTQRKPVPLLVRKPAPPAAPVAFLKSIPAAASRPVGKTLPEFRQFGDLLADMRLLQTVRSATNGRR
jgi:hypothetical protein